jgi:hypothetical protein
MVCRRAIEASQVEREVQNANVSLYAHEDCYKVWREESLARRTMPGREMLDERFDDLSAIIRRKVAAGLLPKDAPVKVWAGYGSGKKCDACDLPTSQADLEYEIDMADRRIFLFHQACLALWQQEREGHLHR